MVQIVGLLGCNPGPTETPAEPDPIPPAGNPPEPLDTGSPAPPKPPAGNPPPPPVDTITAVAAGTVGELNATSSLHGRVYTLGGGRCGVDVPLPPDAPVTSGINLNIQEVDCPAGMLDPVFQACNEGILSRTDAGSCECAPVTGNPPMPPYASACPKG